MCMNVFVYLVSTCLPRSRRSRHVLIEALPPQQREHPQAQEEEDEHAKDAPASHGSMDLRLAAETYVDALEHIWRGSPPEATAWSVEELKVLDQSMQARQSIFPACRRLLFQRKTGDTQLALTRRSAAYFSQEKRSDIN